MASRYSEQQTTFPNNSEQQQTADSKQYQQTEATEVSGSDKQFSARASRGSNQLSAAQVEAVISSPLQQVAANDSQKERGEAKHSSGYGPARSA